MKRFLFITGLSLCIYLIIGCGTGRDGEELPLPPTPPTPVDTVITEPPVEVADSVEVPWWSRLWSGKSVELLENLQCCDLKFRKSDTVYHIGGKIEMNFLEKANIVGTWKLLKDTDIPYYDSSLRDFSCRSVLYIFDDSTLTVVSDTAIIESGIFKYTYRLEAAFMSEPVSNLIIGKETFHGEVAEPILITFPMNGYPWEFQTGGKCKTFIKIK